MKGIPGHLICKAKTSNYRVQISTRFTAHIGGPQVLLEVLSRFFMDWVNTALDTRVLQDWRSRVGCL